MINVVVVPIPVKICLEAIHSLKYHSCKHKETHKQRVFFVCPPVGGERMVIWLNSENQISALGYDGFDILDEDYCDFQEIKDAELTFYV